jgi:uncharacterized membrane protein
MVEIGAKMRINAPQDKVWNIISKVDNDPSYWKGISRIRNILQEQNVTTRYVFLGKDTVCQQRVILFPKEGVHIKWLKGPIIGVKDMLLYSHGNTTTLEIQINYRLYGLAGLFLKNTTEELQGEAELALQLIKEEAEGTQQSPVLEERRLWADLIHERK